MKKFAFLYAVLVILASQVGSLTAAQGDMAGRVTLVEGKVDLLKGGQLPAIPVKAGDGVQTGDVVRTKSLSRAAITFSDNSTLTISPESRVAIEEYMYNPAQNKRNAVIQLFQGLAHVVVQKIFQGGEPNFVVKTHTAIMGIRGTDFGIRLAPNSSTILDFEGVIQVGNLFPEVGQLFRRAFKIAYGWGGNPEKWVLLHAMEGTTVERGMIPQVPFIVTGKDQQDFINQMHINPISRLGTVNSHSVIASGATSETQGTDATKITGQGISLMGLGAVPMIYLPLKPQTTAPALNIAPESPAPRPPHSGRQ